MATPLNSTITITFGDQAENHVGMQKIGKLADHGFDLKDLCHAKDKFEKLGLKCELIDLKANMKEPDLPPAHVLIIRKGVNAFFPKDTTDDLFKEQSSLNTDKKAFMYGRVVNKTARYNLCFSEANQDPDYANKKGRVIAYNDIPLTKTIRENLHTFLGDKAKSLNAEGNYYYDLKKTGIGFHGDTERKIVVAMRLGASMPLHYQWFQNSKPVGDTIKLKLDHGDLYVMSEKATGQDWKKKKIYTLRHAAGCEKYLKVPVKAVKDAGHESAVEPVTQ